MYADCVGLVSTIRYFAVNAASFGLFRRINQSARSMWLRAAPAVTTWPDLTIMRDSSTRVLGYLCRNSGASHQVVVAVWFSSSPDSAKTKVPIQAADVNAPLRDHERMTSAAS